jgi:hypothetical protein
MYLATYYFLGLAGFLIAAMACLTRGRRAGQHVELNLDDLRAASMGLIMAGHKPTWNEIRSLWMKWYATCQDNAVLKQKAIYSWARTLSLCAALCLIGVLLETQYDGHISLKQLYHDWFQSQAPAASVESSPTAHPLVAAKAL